MPLIVYTASPVTPVDFVNFWQQRYAYPNSAIYDNNIGVKTKESLSKLFRWKIGERLQETSMKSVEKKFLSRFDKFENLPTDTSAEAFLREFSSGGAVMRTFWLHCWNHQRFPIYDQHVHRAMAFFENGILEELSGTEQIRIRSYLNRYLPFFNSQFGKIDRRLVDRALWCFGKFIKAWENSGSVGADVAAT